MYCSKCAIPIGQWPFFKIQYVPDGHRLSYDDTVEFVFMQNSVRISSLKVPV